MIRNVLISIYCNYKRFTRWMILTNIQIHTCDKYTRGHTWFTDIDLVCGT